MSGPVLLSTMVSSHALGGYSQVRPIVAVPELLTKRVRKDKLLGILVKVIKQR